MGDFAAPLIAPTPVTAFLPLLEEVVLQCDPEGRITAVSTQWPDFFGSAPEQAIGSLLSSFVSHQFVAVVEAAISTGNDHLTQVVFQLPSGGERWASVAVQALETGERIVVLRDLTEVRSLQEELAILSIVANVTTNLVIVTDDVGAIEWVNSTFERLTGYRLADVEGLSITSALSGSASDRESEQAMRDAIERRTSLKGELLQYTKDGEPFWVEYSLAPVFDRSGHIDRFISVQIDTTERRDFESHMLQQQAELESRVQRRTAQLAAAKELAEQATSAKSSFLSTMSHEIRTPLNAIVGFTALLLSTSLTEQQRTYAEKAERSVALLLGLVNDILDFSKIEAGAMTLAHEPFDVRAIFESVDAVSGSMARAKGLAFSIIIDDEVPTILVGDRLRLSEVVLNLVSNAVKFTRTGAVTVQLGVNDISDDVVSLQCSVTDTGIGVAPASLPHLFEAFTQGDSSTTRHFGGTGLGLAISKSLVELMGGTLTVESAVDHGSTFSFSASFGRSVEGELASTAVDEARHHELSGARILVAEDNPFNQDVVVDLLAARGAVVVAVDNGQRALSALMSADVFDVILMDVQMPVMDGVVATREIRSTPRLAHLPIIGLTANTMTSDQERCLEAGMNEVLSKPYSPEMLYRTVARWLPDEAVGAPSSEANVDPSVLSDLLGGDPAKIERFARKFMDVATATVAEMMTADQHDDTTTLLRLAHSIKSSAATVGARQFSRTCQMIERATRDDDTDERHALVASLAAQLEEVGRVLLTSRADS